MIYNHVFHPLMLLAEPFWVFTEAMIDPRTCTINHDQTEKEEKEVKNVFLQHTQAASSILVRKCVYREEAHRLICTTQT